MPRRKPSRLPKKFARRASRGSKQFVRKRMGRNMRRRQERIKRWKRRGHMIWQQISRQLLRWILALIFLISLIVMNFVLFSPVLHVREIQVIRESPRLDIEQVQDALAPMFDRHLFFLSSFEVTSLIRESIPDAQTIHMDKVYPSTLRVRIALEPLYARLRILAPDESIQSSQTGAVIDFLTSEGIYVQTTNAQDPDILPEIILVDWGVRPTPGTILLTPQLLERMNAAELTLLRQFGKETVQRTVFLRAQEFHLLTGGIELWFDMRSPLDEQIQRYRMFLQEITQDDVEEYIDLRIEGRVVYQ